MPYDKSIHKDSGKSISTKLLDWSPWQHGLGGRTIDEICYFEHAEVHEKEFET